VNRSWEYNPGESVTGIDALRAGDWCTAQRNQITVERLEGSRDLAYVRALQDIELDCAEDGLLQSMGHFVSIHRRQPDDSWRIETILFTQAP